MDRLLNSTFSNVMFIHLESTKLGSNLISRLLVQHNKNPSHPLHFLHNWPMVVSGILPEALIEGQMDPPFPGIVHFWTSITPFGS